MTRHLPTSRLTYRFPIYLALLGVLAGAIWDVACPAPADAAQSTPAPITLSITPRVGFAPLVTRVTIRVAAHAENVEVCLYMEGPLRSNTSCWPHHGTGAGPQKVSTWTLPAGVYGFRADVHRQGNTSFASQVVTVEAR